MTSTQKLLLKKLESMKNVGIVTVTSDNLPDNGLKGLNSNVVFKGTVEELKAFYASNN